MADNRMKHDQRDMNAGDKDKNYGQQSPGRSGQHEQAGQHAGGQKSGGQFGGQKKPQNLDENDEDRGTKRVENQNRGGQNR